MDCESDDPKFDININVGRSDIYSLSTVLPYILKSIWCINIVDYVSVWPEIGQILNWHLRPCFF